MPKVAESISVPHPQVGVEAIPLDDQYGALSRYRAAEKQLGGIFKRQTPVEPHLLASVASIAGNEVPAEEIAEAAKSLQVADDLIHTVPSVPIIYRLHCEDAIGITPESKTEGFRFVDTSSADSSWSHWVTTAPVQRLFSVRTGPDRWEDDDHVEEDAHINMYAALRFLTTPDEEVVDKFLHDNIGMRYVNSRVVVGQQAVNAFLVTKAKEDLFDKKTGEVEPYSFLGSWALLASGALKRIGGSSPIGKHGDFVHEIGVEAMADVVAAAAGYEGGVNRTCRPSDDGNILRRLMGIDFVPEEDAVVVAQKATERACPKEGQAGRFNGLLYGDRSQVESHLTEVAGNFMTHLQAERANRVTEPDS